MTDRPTIRLGSLAAAVRKKLASTGQTISQYVQGLIAKDLRVNAPEMKVGRPRLKKSNRKKCDG